MNVTKVKKNIRNIYSRKQAALYGLALNYAEMAINYFRSVQPQTPNTQGLFWHNRTGQAAARMFTDAEITKRFISWFMSHGVHYGADLELGDDRRREAIKPVIERFAGRFLADAKRIYRDN